MSSLSVLGHQLPNSVCRRFIRQADVVPRACSHAGVAPDAVAQPGEVPARDGVPDDMPAPVVAQGDTPVEARGAGAPVPSRAAVVPGAVVRAERVLREASHAVQVLREAFHAAQALLRDAVAYVAHRCSPAVRTDGSVLLAHGRALRSGFVPGAARNVPTAGPDVVQVADALPYRDVPPERDAEHLLPRRAHRVPRQCLRP